MSGTSAPLTLIGNLPLVTRLVGRGVSVPSLDSSPPDSVSERSAMAFCLKNLLIRDVANARSLGAPCSPLSGPPLFGEPEAGTRSISLGGNCRGLPSSLMTCKEAISPRKRGRLSIRFFWTDKTFSNGSLASSGGNVFSLFLAKSRISREVSWHICKRSQHLHAVSRAFFLSYT